MNPPHAPYVLVVDDDADIRETIELALGLHGHRVVTVASGVEALDWLHSHEPPSLILLDIMMPGMTGAELRAVQLRDPAIATIPTVVLTGAGALPEVSADALAADVLRKPIALDQLLSTVRRYSDPAAPSAHGART